MAPFIVFKRLASAFGKLMHVIWCRGIIFILYIGHQISSSRDFVNWVGGFSAE